MPGGSSRVQFDSPRAVRLVEAWNAGDRAYILDQLSEDIALVARLPKMPVPAPSIEFRSKAEFEARLGRFPGPLPQFTLVSALEDPNTICLVLADAENDIVAVTIELDEAGKYERITSYRPDREKPASR